MQSIKNHPQPSHSWRRDILILFLVLSGLFFIFLGLRPLYVPDEGRYAEIAREMVARKDLITPYLDSIKYFEKPIFFYWLEAATIKTVGLNLWGVRSINALLGIVGCLLTYLTGRRLYNRTTGFLAALILGTSTLYFTMAHTISLDLPVTVFLSASLYGFILSYQATSPRSQQLYLWGSAVAAALAVLTKGLIGIVFPLLIVGIWIFSMKEWRLLKRLPLISSLLIFLVIATPWHWLVSQRNPEFFYFYFIEQHFLRYTTKAIGHYQPVGFFIPYLILGFFPWIVFLPQAITKILSHAKEGSRQSKINNFFLIWAVLIFLFFSFSKSKLIPYILPVIPPLAILTAQYWQQQLRIKTSVGMKISFVSLCVLAIIIGGAFCLYPYRGIVADFQKASVCLILAASILVSGTFLSCFFAFKQSLKALIILLITTGLFLLSALYALPYIDTRTIQPLATLLKPHLKATDEVIAYNQYYQDLPFYLERRVTVLNWQNELSYGMQHQNTREWTINDALFWQRWHSEKRLYVMMGLQDYDHFRQDHPRENVWILGKTTKNILISNKPFLNG